MTFSEQVFPSNINIKKLIKLEVQLSRPPAFKSQSLSYQSTQELMHQYQHAKNQLNS